MSLKAAFLSEIPGETVQWVEALLPSDSVDRVVADCVDDFLCEADFKAMYAIKGRPGVNPLILSLVTSFQFLEKTVRSGCRPYGDHAVGLEVCIETAAGLDRIPLLRRVQFPQMAPGTRG